MKTMLIDLKVYVLNRPTIGKQLKTKKNIWRCAHLNHVYKKVQEPS
jgi:hypothetical protein